jgi:hypothetical protein
VVKEKSSQFYPAARFVARAFCHSRAPRTRYLEAGKFRYKVSLTPHLGLSQSSSTWSARSD